jgi:NAD-dependent SIR2 family protein deacetylase
MPSEKAKENKTLIAQCTACGKTVSAELMHGVLIERDHHRTIVPVCDACRQSGWQPAENPS